MNQLKDYFCNKFFNKTFGYPIDIIILFDLTHFLFVYIPTYSATNLPTYLFTHLPTPTHLPTYHLDDVNVCQCMIYKI